MNDANLALAAKIIPSSYVKQAEDARKTREAKVQVLLEKKKLPDEGWDNASIEELVRDLSMMDSNNFPRNCGVGEREARIFCDLLSSRHYRLGHGIGRSGDLVEVQPKAAGSSLLNKLTNALALDAIRLAGLNTVETCFVVPMATGMTMTLCMLALRQQRPQATHVLWPRIDQKSCFKCIITAGYIPVIVEEVLEGDELRTDVAKLKTRMEEIGSENIACVLSTTSCFAPRAPDKVEDIAKLCKDYQIPHVVNNAYGLQSSKCIHIIQQAARTGRIDVFVQSTDKNFMVPVGGSIVAGFDTKFIESISKLYPGRASASPSMDLFMTLLSMGSEGYKRLLSDRKECFQYLKEELSKCVEKFGERVLNTYNNPISVAVSLDSVTGQDEKNATEIGSMLFTRGVSGTRVVAPGLVKEISGHTFVNFGAHSAEYPYTYLTAAACIGITKADVDLFIKRLEKVLAKYLKKNPPMESDELIGSLRDD